MAGNLREKRELVVDPRGLIYEAYRIDGIGVAECRTIFLDWAIGVPSDRDMTDALQALLDAYGAANPKHPMTGVIREGMLEARPPRRRGGRRRRSACSGSKTA